MALKKTMDWFDTPRPLSSENPATADCAITKDIPIAINGSSMVTGFR